MGSPSRRTSVAVGSTGQDDLRDVVVVRRDVGPDSELANTLDAAGFDTLLRDLSREDGRIPVVSVLVGLGAVVFAEHTADSGHAVASAPAVERVVVPDEPQVSGEGAGPVTPGTTDAAVGCASPGTALI